MAFIAWRCHTFLGLLAGDDINSAILAHGFAVALSVCGIDLSLALAREWLACSRAS